MIQMQDYTITEMPVNEHSYVQIIADKNFPEEISNYKISYEIQNKKQPTIVQPQTKSISPVVNYLISKLKTGTPIEKSRCLELIEKGIESKGNSQYLDAGLTDALFFVADENISKLSGPTLGQKMLRNKISKGKKVSLQKMTKAMELSDIELAQKNKLYSLFLIGKIQNLLYKDIKTRTGLNPKLYDMPATARLVEEVKNNPDDTIKASAIGALYLMNRPEFNEDLEEIFESAQHSEAKAVREYATKALNDLEKKSSH